MAEAEDDTLVNDIVEGLCDTITHLTQRAA